MEGGWAVDVTDGPNESHPPTGGCQMCHREPLVPLVTCKGAFHTDPAHSCAHLKAE